MNDYKELIDTLDCMDFFCDRAGKELWFDKPKEVQDEDIAFHHNTLTEAINAIEQLVKERDAAIADLKSCCAYNSDCAFCKHYFSDDAAQFCEEGDSCGNWEWRGVQEVEHGNG